MLFSTAAVVAGAVGALALPRASPAAALEANLAYRSPSLTVRSLAIDLKPINEGLSKRDNYEASWTGNLTFDYSVASGDPRSDSVILWTHAHKADSEWAYNSYPPVCLHWKVSSSESDWTSSSLVQDGYVQTTYDVDWTAKVEATNLKPMTKYFYRFENCAGEDKGVSPVGMTQTLPEEDADVEKLRMAVFSCSNLPYGFFNAYGAAANHSETLDLALHVGDYIYEYKNGEYGDGTEYDRVPLPLDEIATLADYRQRYQSYRSLDADLVELHRKLPMIAVWDDHEVADNTYNGGSANSNDTVQGEIAGISFSERKAHAVRAYYEWMPIRQVETDDKLRIWRSFALGKLGDLIMLDTRQYDRDITNLYYNEEIIDMADDKDRSMTGPKQEKWMFNELKKSKKRGATWQLLGQQMVFSAVNYSLVTDGSTEYNVDAWPGYMAQRERILKYLSKNDITNTIILSGDSHATWVSDLPLSLDSYDAASGNGSIAVEFAGSAVSSPSSYGYRPDREDAWYVEVADGFTQSNPQLHFAEGNLRGYYELELTPNSATADFYGFVDNYNQRTNETVAIVSLTTEAGSGKLSRPLNGGNNVTYGSLR